MCEIFSCVYLVIFLGVCGCFVFWIVLLWFLYICCVVWVLEFFFRYMMVFFLLNLSKIWGSSGGIVWLGYFVFVFDEVGFGVGFFDFGSLVSCNYFWWCDFFFFLCVVGGFFFVKWLRVGEDVCLLLYIWWCVFCFLRLFVVEDFF